MTPIAAVAAPNTDTSPINRLTALVASDLERVEDVIAERMQSPVGRIPDVAAHLIDAGGKRLRPMVTLASARACGYEGDAHIKLAATVEFIHTATLLHDDVVDGSGLRRGKAAANVLFGNASSVLVGDFLFARSFSLMVEAGSLEVLRILADASSTIAEGEVRQLAAANDISTSIDAYMAIIEAKTAALFAAAAEVGAVIADMPALAAQAFSEYGRSLGLAFQLVDDVLDYGGVEASLGKHVGDDFREGKVTLPVALAYARGDSDERAFWAKVVSGDQEPDDFQRALEMLNAHNALKDTLIHARSHANDAAAALSTAEPSAYRDALQAVAAFVVDRAH